MNGSSDAHPSRTRVLPYIWALIAAWTVVVGFLWYWNIRGDTGILGYSCLWILGLAGIGYSGRRIRAYIHDRDRAEWEQRQSNALLSATLESTADGLLVVDNAGKILRSNRKFSELWRIPEEVMTSGDDNRALSEALTQLKYPDLFLKKVRELYDNPGAKSFDTIEFLDGKVFERYSIPLKVDGQSTGRVWSFRDVTGKLRLEEQLRESQKMEAVGKLAGGIAHEFNNLMTIVAGYCELLLSKCPADNPERNAIEAIDKAGNRAALLTRQLLAFSQKQMLQPEVISLNDLLSGIERMLRPLLGEGITLHTTTEADLWKVTADPSQIEQVIMSLAINARDAMTDGGSLSLSTANAVLDYSFVEAHAGAKAGPHVVLTVRDTGCGMDEETISRIYEPFFTTRKFGERTGLGLPMAYGIVKQSDGYITVESTAGKGTTFRMYFPRTVEEPPVV